LRSCCCARQRCSFVAGACVIGTTIMAGVGDAASGLAGVATSAVAAGSGAAVTNGVASSAVAGMTLGTLLAGMLGDAEIGNRVGCTCTGEGAPICIGCPQPANTSTNSNIYQRRTTAHTDITNNCSSAFYHAPTPVSSRSSLVRSTMRQGHILMSRDVAHYTLHRF
jgi:hypothetical protein